MRYCRPDKLTLGVEGVRGGGFRRPPGKDFPVTLLVWCNCFSLLRRGRKAERRRPAIETAGGKVEFCFCYLHHPCLGAAHVLGLLEAMPVYVCYIVLSCLLVSYTIVNVL